MSVKIDRCVFRWEVPRNEFTLFLFRLSTSFAEYTYQERAECGAGRDMIGQNRSEALRRQSSANRAEGMADSVTQEQRSMEGRAELNAKA